MSKQSKFAGLAGALKERAGTPVPTKKKVAKSQDKENYKQTTAYIHKDVYNPLQTALAEAKTEYSQLIEDLLKVWLEKRKG